MDVFKWPKTIRINKREKFCIPRHAVLGAQDSILGTLLFIIYINNITETACYAKLILYADDANIIPTADTMEGEIKWLSF